MQPKFILDIGACVGEWALMTKEIFPNSEILMLEANRDNERDLLATGIPHRIALLGDHRKEVSYYAIKDDYSKYNTGNSIFIENTKHYTGDNFETKELTMTTLDSELETHWVEKPDFLKMDVQGAELLVLKGATRALETIEFILLETQLLEYNKGAPMFSEVSIAMDELGFQLMDIWGLHYLPNSRLMQLDTLYVKKDSKFLMKGHLV